MQAIPVFDEFKGFADAGEHAKGEDINFQHAKRVDIILVPFDEGAVFHGGIANRHGFIEAFTRQNEAADMLREVAGEACNLACQFQHAAEQGVIGIKADFTQALFLHLLWHHAPYTACQCARHIL